MQKITPFLWFDDQAEEAVNFYVSAFSTVGDKNSKIGNTVRYDGAGAEASGRPKGSVMTMPFRLGGLDFVALNGGPVFKFTPAISFLVNCKTAEEVQQLWDRLSNGGTALMPLDKYDFSDKYGWIQDKYGLSWQIILPREQIVQKVVPSLMFVGNVCGRAEEAINFYSSIFNDSKMGTIFRYGAGREPDKENNIAYADFALEGQYFAIMESAYEHKFGFNEAISFVVNCKSQEEVDHYWNKLTAVPEAEQCGWLKDKYGVSWQIVPTALGQLMNDPDPAKSLRVTRAMLKMKKIEIADLKKAYEQE